MFAKKQKNGETIIGFFRKVYEFLRKLYEFFRKFIENLMNFLQFFAKQTQNSEKNLYGNNIPNFRHTAIPYKLYEVRIGIVPFKSQVIIEKRAQPEFG